MRAALFFAGCLFGSVAHAAEPPRVVLVGDSTMATRTGYGDALCGLFLWQVQCLNLARGGRSTRSYRADGTWDRVTAALREPHGGRTWVLIQFGHNDQPGKAERTTDLATEFPANLVRYIEEVRALGAQPVLVTPLTRRTFDTEGRLKDDLEPWAQTTRRVAREQGVPLLDLHADSRKAVEPLGQEGADGLAMAAAPHKDFDRTHVGPRGAGLFSRMVAAELAGAVPALASHLVVGAVETAGRIERPQMDAGQAGRHSYAEVLGPWDPLSSAFAKGNPAAPDIVVDAAGGPGPAGAKSLRTVQAAIDEAVARAWGSGKPERVSILVKPGTYTERLDIPASAPPITLYGEGNDAAAVRITTSLSAAQAGNTPASSIVRIRARGFQARGITFENAHNKATGDRSGQSQAVAVMLDDADEAHFDNVRFLGFQDTLYLATTNSERPARAFFHRVYVEGDMDYIFGEATAYFLDSEIRTLGDRAVSYALAPSTHVKSRHGFVFEKCRFTHDGSANALAGTFKLARQWNRSPEHVGKVAILNSSIGAHIDPVRPWADWSIGTPRYRPVDYRYLGEYRNRRE